MIKRCLPGVFLTCLSFASAVNGETLLLQQPALSADRLAFVYAGDIWIARRDGSEPRRLTSHAAPEFAPRFSPDGRQLAFAASYAGNIDVYVINTGGGQPDRLTFHPGSDIPTGWTPDGREVTFVSARESDHGRSNQFWHVAVTGGAPRKQMAARIYRGVYDDGGRKLAFIAHGSGYNGLFGGTAGWKGYRGGTTPALQIMDLDQQTVTTVPGAGATNFNPVWLGETLYFLSDRNPDKTFNLFRYTPDGAVTQVSFESSWDVLAADGRGDTLVYAAAGRLRMLDTATGSVSDITISVNPDLPQLRPQWKSAADTIQAADLSPSGKRAVLTARGDVFTVPTDEGSTRNLTASAGSRQYSATWSPDGQRVAWIDESLDGQVLTVADHSGMGERRQHALGPHYYELLAWAGGENEHIVYADNHLGLHVIDIDSGRSRKIASGARREQFDVALSPDGAWLAYTLEQPNYHRNLVLHRFADDESIVVTEGTSDIASPAFSRDGKYLYFAASTNSGPLQVGLNMTSQERPYRAGLYVAVLAAGGETPLRPGTGDEEPEDSESGADDENGENDEEPEAVATRIDRDGLADRIVALPVAEANYDNLRAGADGHLYYLRLVQPGASTAPPGEQESAANALLRFDFDEREASELLDAVAGFDFGARGKHLLIEKTDGSLEFAEADEELEPEGLDLDGLRMRIDPREEWRQIFDETWRMEKEFFYDPGLHGLDWQAVYDRYRPLVDHVGRREDLNALLVQMIAEMQAGHNRVGGGDVYEAKGADAGLLGANFEIANNRYRLGHVYTGERWNPFLDAPLAEPGHESNAGEYLLAVNGRELLASDNLFERLEGTLGKQVTLRVGPRPDGREARDIVVEPVESERMLRLWDWVEENRRFVDEATGGRVGYVYLPNTAGAGYTFFNRMFFTQVDKDAMIIDERANGGGQAANYITEVLSRRHLSGWKDRDGLVFNTPAGALHGPKVMLIDQDAGSGGDYLPYAFRELGIGKLIGTRTWGGLIGISTNPQLVDGGNVTVPFFRFYDTDYAWSVENEGVAPDIEVALDPWATNAGRDTQLERAIEEIQRQLDTFEDPVPDAAPPYPERLGE